MEIKLRSFESKILYFNGMYKLPVAPYPCFNKVAEDIAKKFPEIKDPPAAVFKRLVDFKKILGDELTEIDLIIDHIDEKPELESLTDIADLLGDIIVYCASEMAKFGIPIDKTLSIIMASNFSKLDVYGNPIYDPQTGKVLKGPRYWKPEPMLKEMLQGAINEHPASWKPD